MDLESLRLFFMWCSLINGCLLVFLGLFLMFAGGFVHQVHKRWFPMSKDAFHVVVYSLLGAYKILVIVFNIVPLLAFLIMDR